MQIFKTGSNSVCMNLAAVVLVAMINVPGAAGSDARPGLPNASISGPGKSITGHAKTVVAPTRTTNRQVHGYHFNQIGDFDYSLEHPQSQTVAPGQQPFAPQPIIYQ